MVGDVKQSIYGFRQARPELFLINMKRTGRRGCPEKSSCNKTFAAGGRFSRGLILYSAL
ncbi:MAG: UvrD-helicase domain-containing protein [Clostridia bacterium]